MRLPRQEVTENQLEDCLHSGHRVYGRKEAYCSLIDSCERCDRVVCFWCRVIVKISKIQEKRILKICK